MVDNGILDSVYGMHALVGFLVPSNNQRRRQSFTVQPLSRIPLREDVYHVVRRMIVKAQIQPGAKILEGRLASALAVSRTPVREALRRLEVDGLVVTRPGHSTRVSTLTLSDVGEIYPIVRVLEGLAVRLATPRLAEADLRHMEELTRSIAEHARRGEIEELMAADNQFHGLLHERSQNHRLQKIVRELRGQMERFEYLFFSTPEVVRASVKRHKNLVRVLRSRDALAAQRTLMRQWELGQRALVATIQQKGDGGAS